MIRLEDVTFAYRGEEPVIEHLHLEIREGERICLFGPSGRGKTTILRLILGLEKPLGGRVSGTENLRFSAVFQEDRLLPGKSLLENAAMFSEEKTARTNLEQLGLGELTESLPAEISGGQRRRAALARALAHPFDLLVLDEALTGLDEDAAENCLRRIDEVCRDRTLVMVTHDRRHAEFLGARFVEV